MLPKLDIMEIHLAPKRSYVVTGPISESITIGVI